MALTKNERRALELAREIIATGRNQFVCNALFEVREDDVSLTEATCALEDYIGRALQGFTLEEWQEETGLGVRDADQKRADRLAWIDWMLGKPLAGEAVKLEWKPKPVGVEEAEYCGRFFSIMQLHFGFDVIEIEDPAIGERLISRIGSGIPRCDIDAAIVAHVWPALPPDEPRHV